MKTEDFFSVFRSSVSGLENAFNHYLHRRDINMIGFKVLYELYCVPEGLEPAVIAAKIAAVRPAVTVILNQLEERGFLVRAVRTGDRRKRLAVLTGEGRAFAGKVIEECRSMEQAVADTFPPGELEQMLSVFTVLSGRLREQFCSRGPSDL